MTASMRILLPWPTSSLSPNGRLHWAQAARAKKAFRLQCGFLARQQGARPMTIPAGERLRVDLDFRPPDRRPRDWDNMLASMKSGLDGLADAIGVDDSRWAIVITVTERPEVPPPKRRPHDYALPAVGVLVTLHQPIHQDPAR